jgi:hypothetical protein
MLTAKQESGVMANWVKCTNENGDKVLLNFDYATIIHRNDLMGLTYITMNIGGEFAVKETVDELSKLGVKL